MHGDKNLQLNENLVFDEPTPSFAPQCSVNTELDATTVENKRIKIQDSFTTLKNKEEKNKLIEATTKESQLNAQIGTTKWEFPKFSSSLAKYKQDQ